MIQKETALKESKNKEILTKLEALYVNLGKFLFDNAQAEQIVFCFASDSEKSEKILNNFLGEIKNYLGKKKEKDKMNKTKKKNKMNHSATNDTVPPKEVTKPAQKNVPPDSLKPLIKIKIELPEEALTLLKGSRISKCLKNSSSDGKVKSPSAENNLNLRNKELDVKEMVNLKFCTKEFILEIEPDAEQAPKKQLKPKEYLFKALAEEEVLDANLKETKEKQLKPKKEKSKEIFTEKDKKEDIISPAHKKEEAPEKEQPEKIEQAKEEEKSKEEKEEIVKKIKEAKEKSTNEPFSSAYAQLKDHTLPYEKKLSLLKMLCHNSIEQTLELLVKLINEVTPHRQREIMDIIFTLNNPQLLPFYERMLKFPSTLIRLKTLISLRRLANEQSQVLLLSAASDPSSQVRRMVANCLEVREGEKEAITLIQLANDTDESVGAIATKKLGRIRNRTSMVNLLWKLESIYPKVRKAAIDALESINGTTFGFDYEAPFTKRKKAVNEWKLWWKNLKKNPALTARLKGRRN